VPEASSEARYEIVTKLGQGGAGEVYKAWDRSLHRHVAIKRFLASQDIRASIDERAWKEAMTLASIQHPNITTIYDFGIDTEGGPFVVMEYLEGETLDKVAARGPFQVGPFKQLATQTLEGLIAAHHVGMIHRDLKPQNIMEVHLASGAPQYKILDFGLAKFVTKPTSQTLNGNKSIFGSAYYLSPEQLARRPVDVRSDLYALGCVYYYVLTGRNAFEGRSLAEIITAHIQHHYVPLEQRRHDLPEPIVEWVTKLMSFQPDHRPPTADEALAGLHRMGSTKTIRIATKAPSGLTDKVPSVAETSLAPAKPKRRMAPVVVTLVLLACVLTAFLVFKPSKATKPEPQVPPGFVVSAPSSEPAPAAPVIAPKPVAAAVPVVAPAVAAPVSEPAPAPAAEAKPPSVNPWSHAEIYPAEDLATLRAKVGQTVAVKGRVAATRIKGNQLLVIFSKDQASTVNAVFDLDAQERAVAADRAKSHKGQIVCVLGQVESVDGQFQLRAADIDQLDAIPPL
jgi:serine/threonine protein kinase